MWRSIWNAITSFGRKKSTVEPSTAYNEFSDDDDMGSNDSIDEVLECPICCESFNIVENVPYVLWCGHTICKNCLLGLKRAALKISTTQQIQIPFFISCPWCNLLTLRLVFHGILKAPNKNYFLLWMVESRNGNRFGSHKCTNHRNVWTPLRVNSTTISNANSSFVVGGGDINRVVMNSGGGVRGARGAYRRRPQFSLHKSIDFFIRFISRFPLVLVLVFMVIFTIPCSIVILMLYFAITILFAVPTSMVMYFAYPTLDWLVREISS
ncbi:unnamed protein product [Cuscuta europaea]|uniref:RING-type domain-containing protein n=1 Tax=Cuscuta europaea TaxID=41803 RepID=A0A9P1A155_CUSEU|nr:unnamed protein product [Cuscuta europaea]